MATPVFDGANEEDIKIQLLTILKKKNQAK